MEQKTTNGTEINPKYWYIYHWATNEEPNGFISEGFKTIREAKLQCDIGHWYREGIQYYTFGRTHLTIGRNLR